MDVSPIAPVFSVLMRLPSSMGEPDLEELFDEAGCRPERCEHYVALLVVCFGLMGLAGTWPCET
jgi:hypothetical protein